MSDIQHLRGQISASNGPEKQDLEAMLQIRSQDRSDEARAAINSQIELLNLVIGSGWTKVPFNGRPAQSSPCLLKLHILTRHHGSQALSR